jgi:hypothetical protein
MLSIVDALVRGALAWPDVSRPDTFCASSEKDLRHLTVDAFSYGMIKEGNLGLMSSFPISTSLAFPCNKLAKVNLPGKFLPTTFTHLRIS